MKKHILSSIKEFKEAQSYWLSKFSGQLSEVKLNSNVPPAGQNSEAKFKTILGREETTQLLQISKNNDLSLYTVMVVSLKILLFKYLWQNDIVIVSPIYTPSNLKYNRCVFFRDQIYSQMTFKEVLIEIRDTVLNGYKNEHYSSHELVNQLKLAEGFSLARIGLLLENIHNKETINDIRKEYENDIFISLNKADEQLEVEIIYNSDLFQQESIRQFLVHLQRVITQVLTNTNIKISEIEPITSLEKGKILNEFNTPKTEQFFQKSIPQLFREQVEKNPHKTAASSIVDLNDVFKGLNSKNVEANLYEKLKKCCFKINPYIFSYDINTKNDTRSLKLLKTHRHTSVIVNPNVTELLNCFDGTYNLESIYQQLQNKKFPYYIYPIEIEDLLEISCTFGAGVEKYEIYQFKDFIQLIQLLFKNFLIDLTGYSKNKTSKKISLTEFSESDTFDERSILDDLFNRSNRVKEAEVLLIGDTPGMPSVGLLYLASYLWRNGVTARCHFHDLNGDYESLKRNIHYLIHQINPRVVGVSMKWFPYISRVLEICKIVKAYKPEIKIVLGANSASYYWDKIINYDYIDYIVCGDGEVPLLKICQGSDDLPNCIYKKEGEIITNPITYVHDEINSKDIYLSHLDEILISRYASLFGTFFIQTQKGCTINCCYCGGCRDAQKKTFGRKGILKRGIEEVRKDIKEAKEFASLFMFDLIESNEYYAEYFKKISDGIDLTTHFCIFGNYITPAGEVVDVVSKTFKYVFWELDLASLSERHRNQLVSKGMVKIQPSDEEIFRFYDECEDYKNSEIRMNLIAGLPYFTEEDVEASDKILSQLIRSYQRLSDYHWGRLHAQPGAPITYEADKHHMYSYAITYEDFLKYSQMNFNRELPFPCVEDYKYPYIYFKDEKLNSIVSKHSAETRNIIIDYKKRKRENVIIEEKITYQQLYQKALGLSGTLREKGAKPGNIIGLMMENSLDTIVGILGVLKAGCAYLPVDPSYPGEGKRFILKDSNIKMMVIQRQMAEKMKETLESMHIDYIIIEDHIESYFPDNQLDERKSSTPQDLVYTIYTSGTTGKPKGVLVEQKGLVNYTLWRLQAYNYSEKDVTLQPLSYSMDGFASNFYSSLLSGGTLLIIPQLKQSGFDYIKYLTTKWKITNVSLIPRIYEVILDMLEPGDLSDLRFVVLAGEQASKQLIEKSEAKLPHLRHIIEYGPTEATVTTTANLSMNENSTSVIGHPISNVQVFITDQTFNLQPPGIVGELCISGTGITRGYLNNPYLTAEKFIYPSPQNISPLPTYKTGDMARWLRDGCIEFFGRIDHQVKIRGYRIELGEIENHLINIEGIKEAAVLVKERKHDKYLCAYFVAKNKIDPITIQTELLKRLPDYMIPTSFTHLEQMPMTTVGKIDRNALPDPGIDSGEKYLAPENPLEEKMVKIWSEILELKEEEIGTLDNFFILGGHSLKAVQLSTKIHKTFNVNISMAEMFKAPTVKGISSLIEATDWLFEAKPKNTQKREEVLI